MDVDMEKTQQTPGGAPHRRRRRRGNGNAPQPPRREGETTARAEAPRQPQNPQPPAKGGKPPRSRRPAQGQPDRAETPAQPPKQPRPRNAAAQPPKREPAARPQPAPKAQPARPPRAPRPRAEQESAGLELISRRPPKQKFASFEEYLSAHGGITAPLPPEPEHTETQPEAAAKLPESPADNA